MDIAEAGPYQGRNAVGDEHRLVGGALELRRGDMHALVRPTDIERRSIKIMRGLGTHGASAWATSRARAGSGRLRTASVAVATILSTSMSAATTRSDSTRRAAKIHRTTLNVPGQGRSKERFHTQVVYIQYVNRSSVRLLLEYKR